MEHAAQASTLKEARELAQLTQTQLAEKLNLTPGAVSQWETMRTVPDGAARKLLALIFAVELTIVDSWFERQPVAVAS